MANITFRGQPVTTIGELPRVGSTGPRTTVTTADLADVPLAADGLLVVNIFPSVETPVCARSVRRFNELASELDATVFCVSADLPFALARFCGAENLTRVTVGSAFRTRFGTDYGVTMVDGPMRGLLARAVVVLDGGGVVQHSQLVPEIGQDPQYEAVLDVLSRR